MSWECRRRTKITVVDRHRVRSGPGATGSDKLRYSRLRQLWQLRHEIFQVLIIEVKGVFYSVLLSAYNINFRSAQSVPIRWLRLLHRRAGDVCRPLALFAFRRKPFALLSIRQAIPFNFAFYPILTSQPFIRFDEMFAVKKAPRRTQRTRMNRS